MEPYRKTRSALIKYENNKYIYECFLILLTQTIAPRYFDKFSYIYKLFYKLKQMKKYNELSNFLYLAINLISVGHILNKFRLSSLGNYTCLVQI